MKKMCVLLMAVMLILMSGCGKEDSINEREKNGKSTKDNALVDELVEKTHKAIKKGKAKQALNYGKTAIKEGLEDDEFEELLESLEVYLDVEEALEENDLETATEKFDELDSDAPDSISDLISGLEEDLKDKTEEVNDIIDELGYEVEHDKATDKSVSSARSKLEDFVLTDKQEQELERIIEEYESKPEEGDDAGSGEGNFPTSQEIDGYIVSLKDGMDRYDTALVASMMAKLYRLEPYMNEHQRTRTFAYWNEWNETQKEIEPPVVISPDRALEIAREALDVPSHGSIVVVQNGEYYIARAEVDYGDFVDECGCNISTYDGEVFGQVG